MDIVESDDEVDLKSSQPEVVANGYQEELDGLEELGAVGGVGTSRVCDEGSEVNHPEGVDADMEENELIEKIAKLLKSKGDEFNASVSLTLCV